VGRAEQITKELRLHDGQLYCEMHKVGKLCVYRKSVRWEDYWLDGVTMRFARPAPHFIMALTHNWQLAGDAVDWGTLPIIARLNAMDLHKRDLALEQIKDEEKRAEQRQRAFHSKNEDFAKEIRRPFAKAFNDVNTANLAKTDNRKIKERLNGYC
jgi:hypothetical protein